MSADGPARWGAGVIHVSTASTLVGGDPERVRAAVLGLARRLWAVDDCDLLQNTPTVVMHRVTVAGETACWVTWHLTGVADGVTRVDLSHAEVGLPKPPDPELDEVLVLLLREVDSVRH